MTNIIIAITLLLTYTVSICAVNRMIPDSLSKSVFMLPPKSSWIWTLVIGATAALIMPSLIERASENTQFLAFFACAGTAFVAVTPLIKGTSDMSYKVHMTGAYVAAVCSQLLLAANCWWLLIGWMPWVFAFSSYHNRGRKWHAAKFWAEMTCFVLVFIFLMF